MKLGARLVIGTLLGAFFSIPVFAQESGFYLGAALGQSKFEEWCDTGGSTTVVFAACDDKTYAWKLFGGYRFNRYLAIEGSYIDWQKVTATTTTGVRAEADQQSYGVAAVASLPIGLQSIAFGKLGFLQTEQETRRISPSPSAVEREETELHYGLGVKYSPTKTWGLRVEWENTEKLEAHMLSIGVEHTF